MTFPPHWHADDLWCDLETRSVIDLKKSAVRRYAADRSTKINTAAWWFRGVMKTYCRLHPQLGTHALGDLYVDIRECRRFIAHNAAFDVEVLNGQNPWYQIPLSKVDCTMGRAQALSLPGGLDDLCEVLGIQGKDPRGRQLVMTTCKPRKDGTFNEEFQTIKDLLAYNVQDTHCLRGVDAIVAPLSPTERIVFERTWRKNNFGLPIDVHLATAIAQRRQDIEAETAAKIKELTFDYATRTSLVDKLSQRARILTWCNSGNRAAGLESTQKHVVAEKLLDENLHPDVRIMLELLQSEGGSAPLKAQALLDRHVNGRYKDATRYFGARSGRGTSEGANMFNIARPSGKYDGREGRPDIETVIGWLKEGRKLDNGALTDSLRGCVVAPDDCFIIDEDLKNAELRIALWQAGDTERLAILAGNGDLYMHNGILLFNLPQSASKDSHPKERQTAKNVTLGGNYQLGWKTYMAFLIKTAADNGLKRIDITEDKAKGDIGGYRKSNPKLVKLWDSLADAFRFAIYEPPGRQFLAGKVAFEKNHEGTVWMLLPSGRAVPHYNAHVMHGGEMGFFRGKYGAMRRQKAFGGSLLEISCQSMTRDIVTAAEEDIERELPDTPLILDVYDSILALAPKGVAEQRRVAIENIMSRPRFWTAGLPLGAEGYLHTRMRK